MEAGRPGDGAALVGGVVAGVVAAWSLRALRAAQPGGAHRWDRTNHAGRVVSLLEGPAYVLGASAGALVAGPSAALAPVVAAAGAGGLGLYDDLAGDSSSKGLAGHLGALAHGELTTGAVKILGLGLTGLGAAAWVDRDGWSGEHRGTRSAGSVRASAARTSGVPTSTTTSRTTQVTTLVSTVVGAGVVAGSANLLNLLDLRPGRALKTTLLAATVLAAAPHSRGAALTAGGAAVTLLRPDLAGQTMLGDTGANSAGALLGTAMVQQSGLRGRLAALAVLAGLTLASEKVSFTRVIESTPGLRELDAWGRR